MSRQTDTTLRHITLLLWSPAAVLVGAILLPVFAPAKSDSQSLALLLTPVPTQTTGASHKCDADLFLATSTHLSRRG